MTSADAKLEADIEAAKLAMRACAELNDRDGAYRHQSAMFALVKQRSDAQIARMEAEQGLA